MSYWKDRQQQLDRQLEKDEAKLKKRLSSFYDAEYRKLEKEIAAYYAMYGEDKVIEYRNLMENLSEADRKQLIERMQDFVQRYPEYADMLPVRESIYKLNRLEGLQTSIRMQQLEIGAIDNMELRKHLERLAARSANAAAELMGFGKNFYSVNSDIVKKVVNTALANGENFSKNIWKNRDKLANYLCTDMAQAFARGDSYDHIARNMKKRFGDVSRNDMYRLIYTEGTFVKAEASMQPFIEDFEKYKLSPVGDGKVCSTCSDVAKEVFDIKDRTPGVNFPPLHPWCRCTFTIEVEDWDKWMDDYEAKHSDGQSKNVANRLGHDIIEPEDRGDLYTTLDQLSEDLEEQSLQVNNYLNTLGLPESRWSGVTKIVGADTLPRAFGRTKVNGDIWLRNDAGIKTIIHEHLHTRSVLYNRNGYRKYKWFEENACEMLAEELCYKNNVKYVRTYKNVTEPLRDIAEVTSSYISDYDFALDYFNVSIEHREQWLIDLAEKEQNSLIREKILDSIKEIKNAK